MLRSCRNSRIETVSDHDEFTRYVMREITVATYLRDERKLPHYPTNTNDNNIDNNEVNNKPRNEGGIVMKARMRIGNILEEYRQINNANNNTDDNNNTDTSTTPTTTHLEMKAGES